MGASFANIHVAVGSERPAEDLDEVVQAIVEWMSERGFSSVDDGRSPDRSVLVGVDPGGAWINVYDEAMDTHEDREAFGSLTIAIASRTRTAAVATSVFDSDLAWLGLFEPSGQVAELVFPTDIDDPGDFAASMAPDYERWRPVLRPGARPVDLESVWTSSNDNDASDRDVFVEDRLADACRLLGIDGSRASLGFRYAIDPQAGMDLSTMQTLTFRASAEPSARNEQAAFDVPQLEVDESWLFPTGLLIVAEDEVVRLRSGDGNSILAFDIVNARPQAIDGLRITMTATGDSVFAVTRIEASHICENRAHRSSTVLPFGTTTTTTVELEDHHFDSWPQLSGDARYSITLDQVAHSQGKVALHGRVVGAGSGRLDIEVEAMTGRRDAEEGRASVVFRIRVAK